MGRTNIKAQFGYAASQNFKENMDKHSIKQEYGNKMSNKIYSYSEFHRVKDVGAMLHKHFKENDIDVKYVKDISADHIQGFLNSKVETCTQNTINTYANSIYKLQEAINATYKAKVSWRDEIVVPKTERLRSDERGVNSVVKREEYEKVLDYAKENFSMSGQAIRLQEDMGVRVEEIARVDINNINLEKGTITFVNTKGGRELERELSERAKDIIKETLECRRHDSDKLFNVTGDAINKYLARVQDRLDLERHSNHDIRRLLAQEHYDRCREEGMTIKEAADKTSIWLNHNANREEMLKECYVELR